MHKLEHFETSQQALERSAWTEKQTATMTQASRLVIERSEALLQSLRAGHFGVTE